MINASILSQPKGTADKALPDLIHTNRHTEPSSRTGRYIFRKVVVVVRCSIPSVFDIKSCTATL